MKIRKARNKFGAGCWCIDVSVRVEGKQRRRTKMVPLSECPDRASARKIASEWEEELSGSSLKEPVFADYIDFYLRTRNSHSCLKTLRDEFGHVPVQRFAESFPKWCELLEYRKVRCYRGGPVEGKAEFIALDRTVKKATIQAYKRYAKAVLNASLAQEAGILRLKENPLRGMKVGKATPNDQPLTVRAENALREVIGNDYEWLLPAFEFALCNPIRPQDQFSLRQSENFDRLRMRIRYTPQKTKNRTVRTVIASPIIFPHLESYFKRLPDAEECDFLFFRPGLKSLSQDESRLYQVCSFSKTWRAICRKAEVENFRWYDLRHNAVRFLRGKGFPNWLIQRVAGWCSDEMIEHYDPHDEDHAHRYALELYEKCLETRNCESRSESN